MRSRSIVAVLVTGVVAVLTVFGLHEFYQHVDYKSVPWVHQVVVPLLALVGASWFAHRRLVLIDEGNRQRENSAADQLAATERANLNGAIREADAMMSNGSLSSVIAGQRWLHQLAEMGLSEAELIRSLLCAHFVTADPSFDSSRSGTPLPRESLLKTRQAVLDLLFGPLGRDRYSDCQGTPELGACSWRGLDLAELKMANVSLRNGDFTDANISGTCFDGSDLRDTTWGGTIGGADRTHMRAAKLSGAHASSSTFRNVDFGEANMGNNGRTTRFTSCVFRGCAFEGASWSGAEFISPQFDSCTGITFELCRDARLSDPSGLPDAVLEELRRKGVGGYPADSS